VNPAKNRPFGAFFHDEFVLPLSACSNGRACKR
jgi:hypothetical protein